MMEIFFDSYQEGMWFKELDERFVKATLLPFPNNKQEYEYIDKLLEFDRPDIILVDNGVPIMVIERTVEVPSGHNVGQRFGRLVAAAKSKVPAVYFGPYAAYKHGGETQGPRYMNLRLFYAIERMKELEKTSIVVINWQVDANYEIIQSNEKDNRIKEYLNVFFDYYNRFGLKGINKYLNNSEFTKIQAKERSEFIKNKVKRPAQYDVPPPSVRFIQRENIEYLSKVEKLIGKEIVFYKIGMRYIRSDPYTGSALLYKYLYCGGMEDRIKNLVLHFPNVSKNMWGEIIRRNPLRKDIRLFIMVAEGILFSDGYISKEDLLKF